ncbi:MAG: hypothetical protein JW958_02965 [Candidatus Eisenbacteria bacterium]|nr:hypothetical protein [Candidatus Eisenbacteria bacterium]
MGRKREEKPGWRGSCGGRRWRAFLAAAAALAALLSGAAAAEEPSRYVLLLSAPPSTPHPNGIRTQFARRLEESGLPLLPAAVPDAAEENLAALLEEAGGAPLSGHALAYVRSEAREFGLDLILHLHLPWEGEEREIRVLGTRSPFDENWIVRLPAAPTGSTGAAAAALADSAVRRLGGEPPSSPPRVFRADAEEQYASGLIFGSINLLSESAALDSFHSPALSELGFRLFLRESRERGAAFLDRVRPADLTTRERLVHRVRLARVRGSDEEARLALARLVEEYPNRFDTLLLDALDRLDRGESEEGRRLLAKAVEKRPLDPMPHRLLGDAALRDGFLDLARDEYRRALGLSPRDHLARIGIASLYYSEGLLEETGDILSLPPPPNPHGPEGTRPYFVHRAARADFLFAQGRFHEAAGDLVQARDEAYGLRDEESLIDLTERLIFVYLEAGEWDAAATELAELRFRGDGLAGAGSRPGKVAWLEGLFGAYRGDLGAVAAKKLELESEPGADPDLPDLLDGVHLLFGGSGWEAIPPLRRALHEKDRPWTRHLLGRASWLAKRWGPALRELEHLADRGESFLDLPPVLPLTFYYLGRTLEEQGEKDRAGLAYREFLHYWRYANPERSEVRHARGFLYD